MFKIVYIFLFVTVFAFGALQKDEILPVMQEKINGAVIILQDTSVDKKELAQKLFDDLDMMFDFEQIAKLSLGNEQWKKLDERQKEAFTDHFTQHLKNSFTQSLASYSNQKIHFEDVRYVKNRVHVPTKLVGNNAEYEIIYKYYDAKDKGWLIYDIDIVGVSIIQTYRSQFKGYLEQNSFDSMIDWLKVHTYKQ